MKGIKRRSDCPISYALDIFGDKWSLLIIRDLIFVGKKTYGEFISSEEKISTNILADRLETLECAGLIKSRRDKEKKSRIIYSLTDKGIDLLPAILETIRWSAAYDKKTAAPPSFVERIKNDREALIQELRMSLKDKP
jgi:DNA-binding HxlR family transcriptional regulator